MKVNLTDEQRGGLFKMCGEKTLTDVGYEFGFDKQHKREDVMRTAVYRVYTQVKNDPEKYGISHERAHEVILKVEERATSKLKPFKSTIISEDEVKEMSLKERREFINPTDIKGLVIGGRNKAAKLMNDKLDRIGKSKKLLDDIRLGELATVMAIMVDKAQILQGQSTENIAILSKNIGALTPEEALAHVLKTREANLVEKEK